VIPWQHLGSAQIPGGGELRLMRRGEEFSIMSGAIELMNSRLSGSEKALAALPCERLAQAATPRVLVGGLGMGFTLREALARLGPKATVVVAELVPEVIAWAKGPMSHIFQGSLDDPRVELRNEDVALTIGRRAAEFDAILLDVDNGPGGLNREDNDSLYEASGLSAARRALKPNGVLAVWSAAASPAFTQRLRRLGWRAEEVRVRAGGGKRGARHMIWLATPG
jgi:spermidine synthase